jgi:hypothetical protein
MLKGFGLAYSLPKAVPTTQEYLYVSFFFANDDVQEQPAS